MSLDGRSTYNTVSRTAVVRKLDAVATALIPFMRSWFGQQSTYIKWDADRQRRAIHQGEEWTPWHRSCTHLANTTPVSSFVIFVTADEKLRPGECLAPFLDDVYLVAMPARTHDALDVVTSSIQRLGKTRAHNSDGGPSARSGIAERKGPVFSVVTFATHLMPSEGLLPWISRSGTTVCGRPHQHKLPLLPNLQCAILRSLQHACVAGAPAACWAA